MLSKKKVDQITDLLLLTNKTVKQIASIAHVSITSVRKIKLNYPLFFDPVRKYVIRRKKHNAR